MSAVPAPGRVFGPYDQVNLDAQYNLRDVVPERADHLARWEEDSIRVYESLSVSRDIVYGPHPRQRLDLFRAEPGAPLLVFIHGGYWRSFDKESFAFLVPPFVDAGITVALIDYALCPTVTLPALCAQVRDAMIFLARNAKGLGICRSPFVVAGHSAGGHLAIWLTGLDWSIAGVEGTPVRGAVAISGLFDLKPLRLSYINKDLRLDSKTAYRFSPMHHLPTAAPPVVFCVGGRETDEFRRQQADCVAAWTAAGLTSTIIDMPHRHHFSVLEALGEPNTSLHRAACDLVLN